MPAQNISSASSQTLFEASIINASSYTYGTNIQTTGLFLRIGTFDFQNFEKLIFTNILLSIQDTSQTWSFILGEESLGQFYLRDKYSMQTNVNPATSIPHYLTHIVEKTRATGSYITEFANLAANVSADIVANESDAVQIDTVSIQTTQSPLRRSTVWLNFLANASFPNFEQVFRIDGILRQ